MRKKLTLKRLFGLILKGLKGLFSLLNTSSYYFSSTMEEFMYKFKPLGHKVLQDGKSKHKYLCFDYIFQDVVYTLKLNVSKIQDVNFEVQPIENIILILGGYNKIKELTEFMINEEITKIEI